MALLRCTLALGAECLPAESSPQTGAADEDSIVAAALPFAEKVMLPRVEGEQNLTWRASGMARFEKPGTLLAQATVDQQGFDL